MGATPPTMLRRLLAAGVATALIGALVVAGLAIDAGRTAEGARAWLGEAQAGLAAHGGDRAGRRARRMDAPREERLEAGRRIVEHGGEALGAEWKVNRAGARYFVTNARLPDHLAAEWSDVVRAATDERLPDPSDGVRSWMDAHAPTLHALAAEITAGPAPAWEKDPQWDVTREPRLAGILASHFEMLAAIDASRGEHEAAESLLDAAWTLRAAIAELHPGVLGDSTLLGALRCTRVADPREWIERIDGVDVRGEAVASMLQRSDEVLRAAETSTDDAPRWFPRPLLAVMRTPAVLVNSRFAEATTGAAAVILALDPCSEPSAQIPATWESDQRAPFLFEGWKRSAIADELVSATEREVRLRLTRAVLRLRAGLPPGDPCGAIESSAAPDGRSALRWCEDPHPLAVLQHAAAAREFTFEAQ